MAPVLHQTRASCTALRTAEELCGGAGTSRPGGRRRARSFVAWLALLVVGSVGCGSAQARSDPDDSALRFAGSQPTMEALAGHVLQGLVRQDASTLEAVRLTEEEHNGVVWPELPASAPEINFPVDYAWTNIENRNRRALTRLFPIFADRIFGFQGVECRGPTETFETFSVRTDCYVLFVVDEKPELWEVQAFKDVLVRGGGYKVFRYYDEEPRRYRGKSGT